MISALVGICMAILGPSSPYQELENLKKYLPEGAYNVGGRALTVSYNVHLTNSLQFVTIRYDDAAQTEFFIEGPGEHHPSALGIDNKVRLYGALVMFTSVQSRGGWEEVTRVELLFTDVDHLLLKRLTISQRVTNFSEGQSYTVNLKSVSGALQPLPILPGLGL